MKPPNEESSFEFQDEGELSVLLGIKIEKTNDDKFHLTQSGLIEKVLIASGIMTVIQMQHHQGWNH